MFESSVAERANERRFEVLAAHNLRLRAETIEIPIDFLAPRRNLAEWTQRDSLR